MSRAELTVRAAALCGRSVAEVAAALRLPLPAQPQRAKGFVGQLAERALGADPCAGERPDFTGLQVELKTVPVGADGVPVASTFCCSIDLAGAAAAHWEGSRLRRRLAAVLWLPVAAAGTAPLAARRFAAATLWSPSVAQWALLRADWEELMGAIGAGLGAELRAHRGQALQVRPKAAHARARRLGPGEDGPQAMLPLGFYLRRPFVAELLAAAGP